MAVKPSKKSIKMAAKAICKHPYMCKVKAAKMALKHACRDSVCRTHHCAIYHTGKQLAEGCVGMCWRPGP